MATLTAGTVNYNKAGQLLQVQIGKFNNMYPEQQAQLREPPEPLQSVGSGPSPPGGHLTTRQSLGGRTRSTTLRHWQSPIYSALAT